MMRPDRRPAVRAAGACAPVVLAMSVGCAGGAEDTADTVSGSDRADPPTELAGFRPLFDGETLDGWRGYRSDAPPSSWQVQDGTIAFTPVADGRGDLITVDRFASFELQLEWNVAEGGNSGIFFHVTEDHDYPWESGPEMQVLDNGGHADGRSPLTSAGSNYALHGPPSDVSRPPGSWNEVRLIVDGDRVEHWLNGTKLVEYTLGSPEWESLVASSKFADMPAYGRARSGHIGLQDHGDPVWYRNIRIRELRGG